MTSSPQKKILGSDKLVENRTLAIDENYMPISQFYNGRSIFITGGKE